MEKKYYWLKLKRDFFKRHDIRIIEEMPNGKDYILFYLKLLCESVDHEGELRFSESIPYSDVMLSTITNTNIDIVRSAIKAFTQLEMMEVLDDGTIFMSEVEKLIGSSAQDEHTKESTRLRVQAYRERKRLENSTKRYSNVTCNGEIEKDIEIEKEKDINNMSEFESIWDMYPKKQGKTNAFKAFQKALKEGEKIEDIKAGLQAFKAYLQALNVDSQYIPMGSTWFNQRRWNDDYTITRTRKGNYFAPTGHEDEYTRVNQEIEIEPLEDASEEELFALGIGTRIGG